MGALIKWATGTGPSPVFTEMSQVSVPLLFMIIFAAASFGIFISFIFTCDRCKKTNARLAYAFFVLSIVFAVIFMAFYLACFGISIPTSSGLKTPLCEVARIYMNFASGISYNKSSFIGFNRFNNLIKDFANSIVNFPNLQSQFEKLFTGNLESLALPALQSLLIFSDNYSGRQTSDGSGQVSSPVTVRNLTATVNEKIGAEFTFFDKATNRITSAMQVGLRIDSTINGTTLFKNGIVDFGVQMNNFQIYLQGNYKSGVSWAISVLNTGSSSLWGVFVVCLFAVGLLVVAIIFIWYQNTGKIDRCRLGAKIMLVLLGFICLLLSIFLIYFASLSVGVTTACKSIPLLLSTQNMVDLMFNWGIQADPRLVKLAQNCLSLSGKGSVYYLVDDTFDQLNGIITYLDGLSLFDDLQSGLNSTNFGSNAINALVSSWGLYSQSILVDQPGAVSSLKYLNNMTKCGGVSYQFNAVNCTNNQTCLGILGGQGLMAFSCTDPTSTSFIYNNLLSFVNDEFSLLTAMINDFSGPAPNTPLSLIIQTKQACFSFASIFNNIKNQTGSFINWLPEKGGFARNMNCTVIQQNLLNVEELLCFQTNNNLVLYSVFLAITVLFLFLANWTVYCTMVNMDRLVEDLKIHQDTARNLSGVRFLDQEVSRIEVDENSF